MPLDSSCQFARFMVTSETTRGPRLTRKAFVCHRSRRRTDLMNSHVRLTTAVRTDVPAATAIAVNSFDPTLSRKTPQRSAITISAIWLLHSCRQETDNNTDDALRAKDATPSLASIRATRYTTLCLRRPDYDHYVRGFAHSLVSMREKRREMIRLNAIAGCQVVRLPSATLTHQPVQDRQ